MSEAGKYVVFDDESPATTPEAAQTTEVEAEVPAEAEVDPRQLAREALQSVMG